MICIINWRSVKRFEGSVCQLSCIYDHNDFHNNKYHRLYAYFAGPTEGSAGPEPNAYRNCMNRVYLQCLMPLISQYQGMDANAIVRRIIETDLRETCGCVDSVHTLLSYDQLRRALLILH